jgi:thiamine-phosphate pyrophosphorylase
VNGQPGAPHHDTADGDGAERSVPGDDARSAGALDVRLIVITDRALAAPRSLEEVLLAALGAGSPAVQLRNKAASARELYDEAAALLPLVQRHGARLFINDRLDVAIAVGADGVHLGPADLPVAAARRAAPSGFIIGFSTDDPDSARDAVRDGADYIGCGAVFGTRSKPDVMTERIGVAGVAAVANAVSVPVVAIGGVEPRNVAEVAATSAAGCAVIAAIMTAADPAAAAAQLLAAFTRSTG